jgi:hypothetical protein
MGAFLIQSTPLQPIDSPVRINQYLVHYDQQQGYPRMCECPLSMRRIAIDPRRANRDWDKTNPADAPHTRSDPPDGDTST